MDTVHEPVLLHEIVEAFKASNRSNPVYLDGTLGGAGHMLAMTKAFSGKLTVIGLDRDLQAVQRAEKSLQGKADKVILENQDYRMLDQVLKKHSIEGIDLFLLDLGISSDELDNSGRGFTFQKDEPLLMTMGDPKKYPFTARTIVNEWEEGVIADVIFGYGEEKFARRIARAIIGYRAKKQIETTLELAEIISSSVPGFYKRGKIHPATRTFQALRIAVNDELNALKEGLDKGYTALTTGGRMAIISFHSLEDRIVKDFYKKKALYGSKILTKKPLVASDQERAENPRSRSAKLRILEK
ncbi:MAG: S-adenosyl-methyltransferase MraW [Candidatus Parcubacteria bacterium]|jgi:16S rRNA (cytosine1402-N4)-methyltransferase